MLVAYASTNRQVYNGQCQDIEAENKRVCGKCFVRSRDCRFYTSRFYDRVLHKAIDPGCSDSDKKNTKRSKRIFERRTNELKKLIYSAGREADIPLIGKKTAIFLDKMIE